MPGWVVALDREGALAQAAAVAQDMPLAGVPVLVKDTNVDVAGFATRHGSRFYADAPIAAADSTFTAELPPAVGAWAGLDQEAWFAAAYRYAPFSEIFNLTGQPAISIPAAIGPSGSPIGVQLAATFGEEGLLLGAVRPLEEALAWDKRMPPPE
jgi:Asp-tRNA(Asn)/Glu-tRNA(Gln) amidotransferase A subunit family amidase